MANNKYTRRQKYISTDGGLTFNPVTPPEYIKGELIETDSVDCGAEAITWVPVEDVYICESLVPAQYRWVADTGYMCVGTDKYNLEKEQTSTDGTNWTDTGNTRAGSTLIEANSTDCGYVPPSITRWINVTGEYICVGIDKYNKEKEQISYDSGSTWTDTGETRAGSIIETDSEDCPLMTCCELFESFNERCWPQQVIQATTYTRCIQDSTDGSTNYKSGYSFYAREKKYSHGLNVS